MNAIEQWLSNNTPYNEGVLLYETLPTHNKQLLLHFKKKQNVLLQEKLKYELQKFLAPIPKTDKIDKNGNNVENCTKTDKTYIIGNNVHNCTKTEETDKNGTNVVHYIEQSVIAEKTKQALYFHELPEELRPVLFEANMLFKEMCLLKVQLNELPPLAEIKALELQTEIAEKQKKNNVCWRRIDYWREHKVAPKEVASAFESFSPAKLLKQEQYHFAAISKLEKRLKLNRFNLKCTNKLSEYNKISRAIAKQESNLIVKNEELITIKKLING